MAIRILVAAHRPYWMPDDPAYFPLHVGRALGEDIGYTGDNTGDNISGKNRQFCELTGLYWAWKNLACDIIGLCHYRRYFGHTLFSRNEEKKKAAIFKGEEYLEAMASCDILLPRRRNYYIETVASQYAHAHHKKDLTATREILNTLSPDYLPAFDTVLARKTLHLLNMFVLRRPLFDEYCAWLFPILFRLEGQIDLTGYTPYEQRVFGFLAERLLNVWVERCGLRVRECPVVFLEDINWLRKGGAFLARKFLGTGRR